MRRPPVFVLGAPRSGTSLLYRTLALHPDVAWVNNYVRRVPALPELGVLNRLAGRMPQTRSRVWFGATGDNAYRYAGARSLAERLFPQPVEGEPLFTRRGVPEESEATTPDDRQARLRADLLRLQRAAGGQVLVSKRIGHNRRVPLLHGIFPDARFVVMTRDGRAVARSLLKVDWWPDSPIPWHGGTPRQWEAEGRDPVECAARHWVSEVEAIDAGLAAVPAARVHRLRYEDLVKDARGVLHEVAAFSGLEACAAWDRALAPLSFPDKNRDLADPEVEAFQADALRAKGYLS